MTLTTQIYIIGPSAIHGQGVIAVRDVEPGETIGKAVIIDGIKPVITDMGKYVNHTYQPNSRLQYIERRFDLIATRPIKAGEEIAADYNDTPWFLEKPKPWFV